MTKRKLKFYQKLSVLVKEQRQKLGLTQQDVADVLKIHRVSYCHFEGGDTAIKADALFDLMDYLKIKLSKVEELYDKRRNKYARSTTKGRGAN